MKSAASENSHRFDQLAVNTGPFEFVSPIALGIAKMPREQVKAVQLRSTAILNLTRFAPEQSRPST